MTAGKKYFHDHFVLLLLSINAFLAVAGSILILLRLSTSHGNNSWIVQYRANTGISDFKTGGVAGLLSFVIFAMLVLAVQTMLSLSAYKVNRQLAIFILSLGILLLLLTIIVSSALLVLR
jgi:hypothetical protein